MTKIVSKKEKQRLSELYKHHIIDSNSDGIFNHITALATHTFKVPIACVSLVDKDCVWLKSARGLSAPKIDRVPGLCVTAIEQNDVHYLRDASQDPRSSQNPSVVDGGVRFYAGKSLTTTAGQNIGTICVMAMEPRDLSASEKHHLELLSRLTMNEIERHRNATELAQTQEFLRASEQQYQTLAELSPVGIFRSNASGEYVYANQRASEMTGMSLSKLKSTGFLEAIHPDDRERVRDCFLKCLVAGTPFENEHRNVAPNGKVTLVLAQAHPERDEKGKIIGYIGTLTDMTEQHKLEERIQAAQKYESLALLAGGIAHDFNNLLLGVMGNASLLQKKYFNQFQDQKNLANIIKASKRASDLCSQLLAYAGKGSFKIDIFDLNLLLNETADLLRVNISPNCEFRIHTAEELPRLQGDITQLQQVFMNLITNAADAVGDGPGTIELKTEKVEQPAASLLYDFTDHNSNPSAFISIEVSDSGSGIPEDCILRIFNPFYTTKDQGHGLGMAALLGIVKAHKGGIKVESELGVGTKMTLFFPASSKEQLAIPVEPQIASNTMTGTILIADDDEIAIEILIETLENRGFQILSASNGEEALELFSQHREDISLVVLDVIMPKLDGRDAYRRLRELKSELPVLFTSGYHEHDLSLYSDDSQYGPVDFLRKPFLPDDLTIAVSKLLEVRQ